jgi:SAM-dependent methyltransferase
MLSLLNIGCGGHFHNDWTNIDLVSVAPHVRAYDLRKGLPYTNGSFDAVYTSHVLEHLTPAAALNSLQEQFRVLRPGGIIRTVVPDLENKAREYVRTLDAALPGDEGEDKQEDERERANHEWMIVELLDQMVRGTIGGAMGEFILRPHLENADYIHERIGDEVRDWMRLRNSNAQPTSPLPLAARLRTKTFAFLLRKLRLTIAEVAVHAIAGGEAREAFREGIFRDSGEIHRWMYDRLSLGTLLQSVGFTDVRVCRFDESQIPTFNSYLLDMTDEHTIRKADSLFMEARKP